MIDSDLLLLQIFNTLLPLHHINGVETPLLSSSLAYTLPNIPTWLETQQRVFLFLSTQLIQYLQKVPYYLDLIP